MKAKYRVVVEPQARLDVLERGAWWIANRTKNPTLFETEFAAAVAFLESTPLSLRVLTEIGRPGVRRKLLPKTRHHVYYVVIEQTVHILTVANAQAQGPPDLEG